MFGCRCRSQNGRTEEFCCVVCGRRNDTMWPKNFTRATPDVTCVLTDTCMSCAAPARMGPGGEIPGARNCADPPRLTGGSAQRKDPPRGNQVTTAFPAVHTVQ
eukprot:857799-Prymnesium_polylepis.2